MNTTPSVARGVLRAIRLRRPGFAVPRSIRPRRTVLVLPRSIRPRRTVLVLPRSIRQRRTVLAFPFVLVAPFIAGLLLMVSPAGAASGGLVWQRGYSSGPGGNDFFTALAPAPGGGVFVVGTSLNTTNAIVAARYDAAGQLGWQHTFTDVANMINEAVSAVSDPKGDLIVGGYVQSAPSVLDPVIIEYGPHGDLRWVHIVKGPATDTDHLSLATDARSDVVAAFGVQRSGSSDIVITRYAHSGKRRWTRSYAGAAVRIETGMVLDSAGNVYVTGAENRGPQHDLDVLTLKYDPSGHRRWVRFWDGSGLPDVGYAIALAGNGTLYVGGYTTGAQSGDDALLLEYSTRGALRWSRIYTSAGANTDYYQSVVALGDGGVAAAGASFVSTIDDIVAARYGHGGARRWLKLYGGPDALGAQAFFLARGGGAVYVAGGVNTAASVQDSLLLKYGRTGALLWARTHSSPGTANDVAFSVIVTPGSVYLAGGQNETVSTGDGMLLRYRP